MRRTFLPCLLVVPLLGAVGTATAAERIIVGPLPKKTSPAVDAAVQPAGVAEPLAPPPWQKPAGGGGAVEEEPSQAPRRPIPQGGPGYYPRTPAGARELPPGYPAINNDHSQRPVRDWWVEGRPLGCWGTFNAYGCNSLPGTLHFIFGSCRQFYGEPCLKGAPPSPVPPWAGPETGYHGDKGLPGEAGRDSLKFGWHLRHLFGFGGDCASCGRY